MTGLSPRALAWVRSQIQTSQEYIYLNSGYTGPSPKGVAAAVRAWNRRWYEKGLTTPMASLGKPYMETAPWVVFTPGAAIFIIILGLSFMGEGIRDALDPRLRTQIGAR